MFASSSLEEVYHYVYYQLTSVALTMLDDVNGLSINFFSNEFIQAIVNFFTLFAWGLGLTGAAIAIMDFAVSYQTGGGGSFTGTGMNMLRLLVALLTFSSIPILLVQTGCSFVLYCFCAKPALSARHYHDAGCSLLKPVFFARPAACSCRSTAHCANVRSRYFRKVLTRQRCTQRLLRGVVGQAIRIRRKHHERRSKLFFLPGKSQ